MVNLDILREYGCTSERLRQIFTCTDMENPDWAIKESIQDEVRSRVHEGVEWSARNANPYMAVDLAWDSQTVNKTTMPHTNHLSRQCNSCDLIFSPANMSHK